MKLIRVKQNLLNMSEAYLELAHKCAHLFQAQKEIAEALPDVHDSQLHNVKYTGQFNTFSYVFIEECTKFSIFWFFFN